MSFAEPPSEMLALGDGPPAPARQSKKSWLDKLKDRRAKLKAEKNSGELIVRSSSPMRKVEIDSSFPPQPPPAFMKGGLGGKQRGKGKGKRGKASKGKVRQGKGKPIKGKRRHDYGKSAKGRGRK